MNLVLEDTNVCTAPVDVGTVEQKGRLVGLLCL